MTEYINRATGISRLCVAPMPEAHIVEKEYFADGFPRTKATSTEDFERLRDELYEQGLITMEGLKQMNELIEECTTVHDGGADHAVD